MQNNISKKRQMSESFMLGAFLTVAGGFLDAYTFIVRGGVFANVQTGNIVLLCLCLVQKNFAMSIQYIIPLLSYMLGSMASEAIHSSFKNKPLLHWRQLVIIIEVITLVFVFFIPGGKYNLLANSIISFVCAMQSVSFKKISGISYASTMCTANLRSFSENLYHSIKYRDKTKLNSTLKYLGIILCFAFGAVLCAFATNLFGLKASIIAVIPLIISFFIMCL